MNSIDLGALATSVNEAIVAAVTPLFARIEQLEAQVSKEDPTQGELLRRLNAVESRPDPAPYDDQALRTEVQEVARAVQALPPPAHYDDSPLREIIRAQEEQRTRDTEATLQRIPAPYDDQALRAELTDMVRAVPVPTAYDDSGTIARLDKIEQAIDDMRIRLSGLEQAQAPTYDDKGLREELASVQRSVGEARKEIKDLPVPTNGRDAAALEILPTIDGAKSYPRGTWAKHAGGLWWAFQQTSDMRGWECMVEGIQSVTPSVSGKTLGIKVVTSSGDEVRAEAFVPVQVYRGVWAEGEFECGDTATWAGSLWHCNQTGTKSKPGDGSTDWTLAVKKGRDAAAPVKL